MKATLSFLFLLAFGLTTMGAQEVTTVQVAPSDQIIYPDASQILNKTEPKTVPKAETKSDTKTEAAEPLPPAVPSSKPLLGSDPVPAKPLPPAKPLTAPKPLAPAKPAAALQGWFLRWTLTGDESGARAWAAAQGAAQVAALGPDTWEVLAGPLTPEDLQKALQGQAGKTELVRR